MALVFFCFLTVLPLYMVGNLLINPCVWPSERQDICEYKLAKFACCQTSCWCIRVLLYVLLLPRSVLFAVFVAPVKLTALLCGEICQIF